MLREVNTLKNLDHPNILKIFEVFSDNKRLYIVTELIKGGELFDKILSRDMFTEHESAKLMY